MTTIIATPRVIYSDSHCEAGVPFKTAKMAHVQHEKSGEDYLIGGAGYLEEIQYLARLLAAYGLPDLWKLHQTERWPPKILKDADTDLLVVTREKKIYMLNKSLVPMLVDETAYAIGSGAEYAMSALAFGKSPSEAVAFACERDSWSKPPVQELKFTRRKHDAISR